MNTVRIDPLPNERLLAGVTYDTQSRPFGLALTDRAIYFSELNRWSLKEPWVVRRFPNEQVRHAIIRRTRPLPILILAIVMILAGGALTFIMLMSLVQGEDDSIPILPLALLFGGIVLPFTARGRRTLRIAFTNRADFQWKPPLFVVPTDKQRLQIVFATIVAGCEEAHIRVILD